jgi:phosphomannomutase
MIQAVNAAVGGEGTSGGIIFPAVHLCRDSYSGMAMFLDRMAQTGLTISQLAARLNRYYRKIGKVAYQHGQLGSVMQELETRFPDAQTDRSDGLKLIWPERWIHVRASNTEPILRFSAEAKTREEMERMYSEVAGLLRL